MKKSLGIIFSILSVFGLSLNINTYYNSTFFLGNNIFYFFILIILLIISCNLKFKYNKSLCIGISVFMIIWSSIYCFCLRNFFFLSILNVGVMILKLISYNYLLFLGVMLVQKLLNKVERKRALQYINSLFVNKRKNICSLLLALVFSLFNSVGKIISVDGSIIDFFSIENILVWLISFIFIFLFLLIVYSCIDNSQSNGSLFLYKHKKKIFILTFLVIISICSFYYLKHFPGVFSQDSFYSLSQLLGYYQYSDGHPVAFTLILKLFTKISSNIKLDMVIFCITQMIALALTFSYIIYYLIKNKVNYLIIILSFLFLALSPVNAMYSFTVWKDIPFSISVVFFIILILELIKQPTNFFKSPFKIILLIILTFLVSILRNNGYYMILLTVPFIILLMKSYRIKLLIIFIISFGLFYIVKGPFYDYLNVEKGPVREMLSIPMQQIARTFHFKYDELSTNEISLVNKYLDAENIGKLYDPRISDPVKSTWKDIDFSTEKSDFFRVWWKLLKKYPIIYVDSFLANNYGYWYPPTVYWMVYTNNATEAYWLYHDEWDLDTSPLIDSKSIVVDALYESRNLPIISMIHSLGFIFWMLFFLVIYVIIKKKYKLLIPYILMLVLWLTLIASPVYAEFRYAYSLFISLPILCAVSINNEVFVKFKKEKDNL